MRRQISRKSAPWIGLSLVAMLALSTSASALPGKGSVDSDDLAKNVVKTSNVKNGSLIGADLKANSINGKQVKESSLGIVPSARNVSTVNFFSKSFNEGQSGALFVVGVLSLTSTCEDVGGNTESEIFASSSVNGSFFAGDDDSGVLDQATPTTDRNIESLTDNPAGDPSTSDGYDDQSWMRAANGKMVFASVGAVVDADLGTCEVFGTYYTA